MRRAAISSSRYTTRLLARGRGRIHDAFAILRGLLEPETVVIFAKSVGRAQENILVTQLAEADPSQVDMSTLVIVGARGTRVIARAAAAPFVYTSRKAHESIGA